MSQYDSLLEYLYAAKAGGFGWKDNYAKQLPIKSWAWRAGYFEGLLNDLVNIVGKDRCIELTRTLAGIED